MEQDVVKLVELFKCHSNGARREDMSTHFRYISNRRKSHHSIFVLHNRQILSETTYVKQFHKSFFSRIF